MKLGYFPGCSLHATAREFDESLRVLAPALGFELNEIDDWACCGATSAHATNHLLSVALPARTLSLATEQGFDSVLAPCAACYSRLAVADHEIRHDKALAARVEEVLQRRLPGDLAVLNIAQFMRDSIPAIREKLQRPLKGLKVACYYGCLLVRPPSANHFDDVEAPTSMEQVVEALGATPVVWNRKLDCCGAGFALSRTGSVLRLGKLILEDARQAGADAVVVGCPMCHNNLDFRQKAISKKSNEPIHMPILFLTELVGLGLGFEPSALGLERHFVPTDSILARVEASVASVASASPQTGKSNQEVA